MAKITLKELNDKRILNNRQKVRLNLEQARAKRHAGVLKYAVAIIRQHDMPEIAKQVEELALNLEAGSNN